MTTAANQDRFLGALLGMAIGDAMGMPVAGWSPAQIRERLGRVTGYHRRVFPDGTEIEPGEFTDESEIALCIVESMTTNQGRLDADNIGARMLFLARGESRRWMGQATLAALARAEESQSFTVPLDEDGPATGDVAARGIPIGLLHAVGEAQPEALRAEAEAVTRITHGSPAAIAAASAVAHGVALTAGTDLPPAEWMGRTAEFLGAGAMAEALHKAGDLIDAGTDPDQAIAAIGVGEAAEAVVAGAFVAATGGGFARAVETAVNAGGAADARGAIAGALIGARVGSAGIPQPMIDDLGGRIYVSLAAPWFHKTALARAGDVIWLEPGG